MYSYICMNVKMLCTTDSTKISSAIQMLWRVAPNINPRKIKMKIFSHEVNKLATYTFLSFVPTRLATYVKC